MAKVGDKAQTAKDRGLDRTCGSLLQKLCQKYDNLAEVDKLTGLPKANDIVVALVPMCAPYSAISTYKYKVKLQQGTLKRGKAQKLIKNLFQQQFNKVII